MQPVELTRKTYSPLMQRLLALCATPNLVGEKSAKIRNSSSPNRSQSVPSPNLFQSAPEISLPRSRRSRGWPTDVHQTLGTAAPQRSYETNAPLIHSRLPGYLDTDRAGNVAESPVPASLLGSFWEWVIMKYVHVGDLLKWWYTQIIHF